MRKREIRNGRTQGQSSRPCTGRVYILVHTGIKSLRGTKPRNNKLPFTDRASSYAETGLRPPAELGDRSEGSCCRRCEMTGARRTFSPLSELSGYKINPTGQQSLLSAGTAPGGSEDQRFPGQRTHSRSLKCPCKARLLCIGKRSTGNRAA